jgi:hypothetical protein
MLAPGSLVKRRLQGWYAWVSWLVGIRWHMGVYVGEGMVIHYNGEKKSISACLCKEPLTAFAAGGQILLHAAPHDQQHGAAICAEAERLWREEDSRYNSGNYDFAFHNCEDFCVACYEAAYA